jgi:hypothetical protein
MSRVKKTGIKKEDWYPQHEPMDFPPEFFDWIDSILVSWKNRKSYRPFELYKNQAYDWLSDKATYESFKTKEERVEYLIQERERCITNSVYKCIKYGKVYEFDHETERYMEFMPWPVQEFILFLEDCGYSYLGLKGRQIGFTTVQGINMALDINFKNSLFIKFIACDESKTKEIFEYKIKWPFTQIDKKVKASIGYFSKLGISLFSKKSKGEIGGRNSSIIVDNPKIDAINGGSPSKVKIDEVGLIDKIFGDIMREGRPTLFYPDKKTGKLKMKRQVCAWGTGGDMDKGGSVLEEEFMALLNEWKSRKIVSGIIPLFFDFWAREGMTQELYDSEKKKAYSTQGTQRAKAIATFHQHYPTCIEDVFIRNEKTLMSHDFINTMMTKILRMPSSVAPEYGRFNPIYDKNQPTGNDKIPYKIIGAEWEKARDAGDPRTTACMWMHPVYGWIDRYFQGVDPINSETGHSYFSASIWDKLCKTVSCCIFYREPDYEMCYLQGILMGMYYDTTKNVGVPDLVENNIGDQYIKMRESLKLDSVIVATAQLDPALQGGSAKWWGISKKSNTAGGIVFQLQALLDKYAKNILMLRFWVGLKKFVEKDMTRSNMATRDTRWGPANKKVDRDDDIDSITYAWICSSSFDHLTPKNINIQEAAPEMKKKVSIVADITNGFNGIRKESWGGRSRVSSNTNFNQYE